MKKRLLRLTTLLLIVTLNFNLVSVSTVWATQDASSSSILVSPTPFVASTPEPIPTASPVITPTPSATSTPQPSSSGIDPNSSIIDSLDNLNQLNTVSKLKNQLKNPSAINSAQIKQPKVVESLKKSTYKANEKITLVVENAKAQDILVRVTDLAHQEIAIESEQISDSDPAVFKISPKGKLKPGKYQLEVKDSDGKITRQNFNWGVLAINTNKSIYLPNQQAKLTMAILDQSGAMVCDADAIVEIVDPQGSSQIFNSNQNQIKVNPACFLKNFTLEPDYEVDYQTGNIGVYKINFQATTKNGTFSISDSFEVRDQVEFDVERSTVTRIYPPAIYPVQFNITANQDFTGVIKETVPATFDVSNLAGVISPSEVETIQARPVDVTEIEASVFGLVKPFQGDFEMTLGFGEQHNDPKLSKKYLNFGVIGHDGVDFDLPSGTAVYSTDEGEVVFAGQGDYGDTVVIQHKWGKSYYGHLSKITVLKGQSIGKGEQLGLSGSTGLSSGPHLHFGVKPNRFDGQNGYYGKIDPAVFLGLSTQFQQITSNQTTPVKVISWQVNIKKGENLKIGYQFKAAQISPEFYTIGPLTFMENNQVVFKEARLWQIAADAVTNDGNIVYGDKNDDDNLNFRTYTGSSDTFGAETLTVDTTTETSDINHAVVRYAPTRNEKMAGHLKAGGLLNIVKCADATTGTCDASGDWSEELEISAVSPAQTCDNSSGLCEQVFDIAYEQLSGRTMVVYGKAANDGILYYNIYNGTSWAGEASFTFKSASANDTRYMKMQAHGENNASVKSNKLVLTIGDAGSIFYAMIWDGSAWGNLNELTTTGSLATRRPFGANFETVSGSVVAVYSDTTTNSTTHFKYKVWDGTNWDVSGTSVGTISSARGVWVEMASDPQSNRIAVALESHSTATQSVGIFTPAIWKSDGSTAGFTIGNADTTLESPADKGVSVAWEHYNSGTPFAIFVSSDNADTDVSDYETWTSGTGFSAITDIDGAQGDDPTAFKLTPSPNSDKIMLLGVDITQDLNSQTWSGSAWNVAWNNDISTVVPPDDGAGSNKEVNAFDFAFTPYSAWSRNWQFYSDTTSNTPTTGINGENTTATGVTSESFVRLRFQFIELSNGAQTDARKKLQYTSGCNPNTSETACTWSDVGDTTETTAVWRYATSAETCSSCSDNTAVATNVLTGSTQVGAYISDKDAAGGTNMDHNGLAKAEYDYPLKAETVVDSTTYYFRVYDVDQNTPVYRRQDTGTTDCLSAACAYPSLTIGAAGPTNDQLMRHGRYFSSNVIQPFTF